jgi:hypothetical protein
MLKGGWRPEEDMALRRWVGWSAGWRPHASRARPLDHPRANPLQPPNPLLNPPPRRLVREYGEGNWSAIARALNDMVERPHEASGAVGRVGKQCRERWNHHLRPDINKNAWTEEEEGLLVAAHKRWVCRVQQGGGKGLFRFKAS